MRTIEQIITACGGPEGIEKASGTKVGRKGDTVPGLSHWAVRKWLSTGIPEKHWPLVQNLSSATVDELYGANQLARAAA